MPRASGTFEVKIKLLAPEDKAQGSTISKMSIDKEFYGDLQAISKGEMLSAVTDVQGSAGYVAIERVVGSLHGRKGSFVLQHSGIMTSDSQKLTLIVIPDSGTDELVGIAGNMSITITAQKHSYNFDYQLP